MDVLGLLGDLLSKTILFWIGLRFVGLGIEGKLGHAFTFDRFGLIFWTETLLILLPALVLRVPRFRTTPQLLLKAVVPATLGGLMYRFDPTTITFDPGPTAQYFPTVPELFITVGLISMAVLIFSIAVKTFAVLPAPMSAWYRLVDVMKSDPRTRRDDHGNPIDD